MKKLVLISLLVCHHLVVHSQDSLAAKKNYASRKYLIGGLTAAGYAGSLIALNEAWYKDYPKTSFHTFNDAREWLQVDKVGHGWTAYNTSRATTAMWQWAGYRGREKKKAVWLGSISGFTYLTVIEFLDAHSAKWGWSWPDVGANLFGTGLFAGQEFMWNEQRIQFKFSSHQKNYAASLEPRVNHLYGAGFAERLLKDYNAQTYWLSWNAASFFPHGSLPRWLNISIGYGAEGLLGGFSNLAYDDNGNIVFDGRYMKRYRQWYLAPDIDLTKIRTRSALLRTIFASLNSLKFPAPALEFSNSRFKLRALAF